MWPNIYYKTEEVRIVVKFILDHLVVTVFKMWMIFINFALFFFLNGPRQANLVLIAYASSEGSGEPAHPRSLARTSAARSYKQWVKRNFQTESQNPSPSEWLGMRSWNLSWRNARRHKFAWRGPNNVRVSSACNRFYANKNNKRKIMYSHVNLFGTSFYNTYVYNTSSLTIVSVTVVQ